jgi:heme/copper-type cytochrome/quinol oxidase subunit 2
MQMTIVVDTEEDYQTWIAKQTKTRAFTTSKTVAAN